MTAAWIAPTRAAIGWRAPTTAGAVAVVAALIVRQHGEPLPGLFTAAVLAVACGLLGPLLDDEAHDLLAAMPAGPRRRLLHRLAWVAPVLVGGAGALLVVATGSLAAAPPVTLIALLATGVAAFAVTERGSPVHAPVAPAAFAALWLVCDQPLGDHAWAAWSAAQWTDQPLSVVVLSMVVAAVALDV